MAQVRSWAGLDVHAATVLAATMDSHSGGLVVRRLPGATAEVVEFCAGLPGPVRVAYEAGPTGFGLARALEAASVCSTTSARSTRYSRAATRWRRRLASSFPTRRERRPSPGCAACAASTPCRRSACVEQPPRRPRSILDNGLSRRKPVLRPPRPTHISPTAHRAQARPAAPLTDKRARLTPGSRCYRPESR